MIILGINAYHPDSAACLLIDGELKIALEEERLNRIKHWSGLPLLSIKKCLLEYNLKISDVDYIAINKNFYANFFHKAKYFLLNKSNLSHFYEKFKFKINNSNTLQIIEKEIGSIKSKCKLIPIEHHKAHMASAFYESPYDNAVNLSVDGSGDFASTTWGTNVKNILRIDERIFFPHSLGVFYEAFTQFLGFPNYGEEYKVMGLSAYGVPSETNKIEKIIKLKKNGKFSLNLEYFNHHKKNLHYSWNDIFPKNEPIFNEKISKIFGLPRSQNDDLNNYHKNLAASVQKFYEISLFHILDHLYKKYKLTNLTLSGGCAQNSLANGKILGNSNFKSLYIPSNPGDGGGAVGAAYCLWGQLTKSKPKNNLNAYLGKSYSNNYIKNVLDNYKIDSKKEFQVLLLDDFNKLSVYVAEQLSKKKIIGWFQDKMEWGPRALGNRSIIADPRNADIRNILNLKIKRRESFRPFAPSVLFEEANNWFEDFTEHEPYMSRVLKFKKNKVNIVPGVVHVDETGRLQTVKLESNYKYYSLIKEFFKITKVPIILNTSFNENEPIVNTPEEAINCFLRTQMDLLVLQNYIIIRK
jgi:carbamoyltransferase